MKSSERRWLLILGAASALCLSGIDGALYLESRSAAADSRSRLHAERGRKRQSPSGLESLSSEIEELKAGKTKEEGREAADPVRLGTAAKDAFSKAGLAVSGYSVARGKGSSVVDFELEGDASGLWGLLAAELGGQTGFSLSRCAISKANAAGRLRILVGVSAERPYPRGLTSPESSAAAALVASIAGKAPAAVPRRSPPPPAAPAPKTERASWIAFIGKTVSADGTVRYFLKDGKAGIMLELQKGQASDSVMAESEDALTIRYQGAIYEIRKK